MSVVPLKVDAGMRLSTRTGKCFNEKDGNVGTSTEAWSSKHTQRCIYVFIDMYTYIYVYTHPQRVSRAAALG